MYITMKTYRYISLATLVLSLAACSQSEDFASQSNSDAVRINATIGTMPQSRINYLSDGSVTFVKNDQIRVINQTRKNAGKDKCDAVYQYRQNDDTDIMEWIAFSKTNYVVREGTDVNTFYGVYPHTADYDKFTIPADQSMSYSAADWMTATTTSVKSGSINLTFMHRLAMVTVKVAEKNDELPKDGTFSWAKIYTKGAKVTVSYGTGTDGTDVYTLQDGELGISPLINGRTNEYPTFTAIVAPVAYNETDEFMSFEFGVYDNTQSFTVLAKASQLLEGLKPGKHYTFNLTVGKEKVEINSVSVTGWGDGGTIDGGVAEEDIVPES